MGFDIGTSTRMWVIAAFIIYTVVLIGISYYTKRIMDKTAIDRYVEEFYTGGRGMGTLVIALMVAATMASAGSFMGTPGLAYSMGFIWLLIPVSQCLLNLTILGTVGKKVGIVARRINAQSYVQLLSHRYNNNKLVVFAGVFGVMIFMGSFAVAQFVGGARLFESMTGLPYWLGLVIFSFIIMFYAAFGGIRGASAAIVFQGLVMTVSVLVLFFVALNHMGPIESVTRSLTKIDPMFISPWKYPPLLTISFWLLFGGSGIGTPHGTMGALTYKNTKSMHNAIILGIVFLTLWTLILSSLGMFSRSIFPQLATPDYVIPALSLTVLPSWLSGTVLAGVAGAIQSTVGAMIVIMSSAIVKDAYVSQINPNVDQTKLKKITVGTTAVICLLLFVAALNPPAALQWLIVFAAGAMVSCFLWAFFLGLYWKRINEYGAATAMISGSIFYVLIAGKYLPISLGMNPFIVTNLISGLLAVAVSLLTPKTPKGIILTWFGQDYPKEIKG